MRQGKQYYHHIIYHTHQDQKQSGKNEHYVILSQSLTLQKVVEFVERITRVNTRGYKNGTTSYHATLKN